MRDLFCCFEEFPWVFFLKMSVYPMLFYILIGGDMFNEVLKQSLPETSRSLHRWF